MTEAQKSRQEKEELKREAQNGFLKLVALFSFVGMLAGGGAAALANEARTSSDDGRVAAEAAERSAVAAERAVTVVVQSAADASCRSLFGGRVTDARTAQDSLVNATARALIDQDADAAQVIKAGLEAVDIRLTEVNAEYQSLLELQESSKAEFRNRCAEGPQS